LVVNSVSVIAVHPITHPLLEGICWDCLIGRPTVSPAFWPPSAFNGRKVADRVPHRYLVLPRRRPREVDSVTECDENKPLPELGNPVLRGVHNALLDGVAEALQLV